MPQSFKIAGHDITPEKFPLLGEGGTARVYDISSKVPGAALKVLRPLSEFPRGFERTQAAERLEELKERLESFPMTPPGVARPEGLILEGGQIAAILMRKYNGPGLDSLYDYAWRVSKRYSDAKVREVFRKLAHIWRGLHAAGIIVGDVKPENVILEKGEPVLIDTEGLQYGKWRGRGYTPSCVDPLICKRASKGEIRVTSAFSVATDYYGLAVMCFQALTLVHPFDGMYWKNKNGKKDYDEFGRMEHGIHVFHPAVSVPKFARLTSLGDELTEYFREIFSHRTRRPFPVHVLEEGWSRIDICTFQAVRGGLLSSAQL